MKDPYKIISASFIVMLVFSAYLMGRIQTLSTTSNQPQKTTQVESANTEAAPTFTPIPTQVPKTNTRTVQKTNANNTPTPTTETKTTKRVPVFISYGGYVVNCPEENVSAVQSISQTMENRRSEWAKNYNDCVSFEKETEPCRKNCDSQMKSAAWNCIETYSDTSSPEYKSCQDGVTQGYLACTRNCPDPNKTCERVFAEQRDLSSQIYNLCK